MTKSRSKEIYERLFRNKTGNVQKASRSSPEMLRLYKLLRQRGRSLDRKLYELIYLRVSLSTDAATHAAPCSLPSKRAGLDGEDWTALGREIIRLR